MAIKLQYGVLWLQEFGKTEDLSSQSRHSLSPGQCPGETLRRDRLMAKG